MSAHLCVRSHYSLLNGLMSVEDIVLTAKEYGYSAVALTEHKVMFSALDFYVASKKHNIKPIFGLEIVVDNYKSLLLAKDNRGLQVLHRLSYLLSFNDSLSYSDFNDDMNHLIFILYSEAGPFEKEIINKDWLEVSNILKQIRDTIGSLYLGISHQESKFFHKTNEMLVEIAQEAGIKAVAVPKVYYKNEEDEPVHRALRAIDNQKLLTDTTLSSEPGRFFYTKDDFKRFYEDSLLVPIGEIIEQCNVDFKALKTTLPKFQTGQDVENSVYLNRLSEVGLKKRLNNTMRQDYFERLQYELNVINSMNFTDYFLIVYDLIRYAKQKGINVGPGRGSAAGSLVAYSLGITDVDPIEYGLLFERFLNPERLSMPDIDIDFPDDRREEVVNYAIMKYGKEHVAHIAAFGSLQARQSMRDCARILNIPIHKINQATKMIGYSTLHKAYTENKRFNLLINTDKQLKECFDLAVKIEGNPRHITQHAAGVVLSDKPILDVAPMVYIDDETNAIQYDMTHIESLGLIKIDFLGLRNLSLIDRIVRKVRHIEPSFRIQDISLSDTKTFELLSKGETIGIFQLESDGMKKLLMQMKPTRFLDIVDTIALYRPGPMENIPLYLKNRSNPQSVRYLHKDLESITKDTFGILVYQEQIMQVAQVFAGFSLGKADILRRAMSKKDASILKSLEEDFVKGSIKKGYDKNLAVEVFKLIYRFANYGFNKSHSVAYGLIAYQLAFLKANFSEIFYTELLTSVINDEHKTKQYLDECRKANVLVLPPNLDQSSITYHLESGKIRFPLTVIKGISMNVAKNIVNERENRGSYTSFINAVVRLSSLGLNRKQFEALFNAGAFDYFGINRESLHASLDSALQYASLITIKDTMGQIQFNYSILSEPQLVVAANNRKERLQKEWDSLGFYLSEHPVQELRQRHQTDAISSLVVREKPYRVIAKLDRIRNHRAKNGKMMAFTVLSDDTGTIDGVLFPGVFEKVNEHLSVDALVLVLGKIKEEGSILIDKIHIFEE